MMRDEFREVANAVGDQADLEPCRAQFLECRERVLEQLEVLGYRPALLDLGRALRCDILRAAHTDEDLLREAVPDRLVVQELRVPLQVEDCSLARLLVATRIESKAVSRRDARVALRRQLRPGTAEREIDVEQNCPQRHQRESWSQRTLSMCVRMYVLSNAQATV